MGMDKNHINLLSSAYPKIKKELWDGEFWSNRYYVAIVSERRNRRKI